MAVITHAQVRSKLSQVIDLPGGLSVGVALSRARANIESRRAEAMGGIEIEIATLEGAESPATIEEQPARLNEAYRAANGVIDAAGPFELGDLCKVASGLCDLIDSARTDLLFDWRIVTVYARSLRLLHKLPLDETAARNMVLDSLRSMEDRKFYPPAA